MHKDVPRLLKGMLVIGPQGERLYVDDGTAKPSDPPAQATLTLTLTLTITLTLTPTPTPTLTRQTHPHRSQQSAAYC